MAFSNPWKRKQKHGDPRDPHAHVLSVGREANGAVGAQLLHIRRNVAGQSAAGVVFRGGGLRLRDVPVEVFRLIAHQLVFRFLAADGLARAVVVDDLDVREPRDRFDRNGAAVALKIGVRAGLPDLRVDEIDEPVRILHRDDAAAVCAGGEQPRGDLRAFRQAEKVERRVNAVDAEVHQRAGFERGVEDVRQAARKVRVVLRGALAEIDLRHCDGADLFERRLEQPALRQVHVHDGLEVDKPALRRERL